MKHISKEGILEALKAISIIEIRIVFKKEKPD